MPSIKNFKSDGKIVFLSWLLSYLIILFIPVIISRVLYYQTRNTLENETVRANTILLKQGVQVIDSGFQDLWNLGVELEINENIRMLMHLKKPFNNMERYIIGNFVKREMSFPRIMGSIANDFYIYFHNGDFVLRPGAYYEPITAFHEFHNNSYLDYDEWYDIIKQTHNRTFMPIKTDNTDGKGGNKLAYIHSLSTTGMGINANLVVFINEDYINQIVYNMEWISEGAFFIIDESNRVVLSNTPNDATIDLKYSNFDEGDGIIYKKIDGENLIISYDTKVSDHSFKNGLG